MWRKRKIKTQSPCLYESYYVYDQPKKVDTSTIERVEVVAEYISDGMILRSSFWRDGRVPAKELHEALAASPAFKNVNTNVIMREGLVCEEG